jgi:hypothetical protein
MALKKYLEYRGYRTGTFYLLKDMPVRVRGFCSQKVWISKDNLYRIRDFMILEFTNHSYGDCLWQIGKTVWSES